MISNGEDEFVKAIRFGDADRVALLLACERVDVNEKRRYFFDVGWDDWATPLRSLRASGVPRLRRCCSIRAH